MTKITLNRVDIRKIENLSKMIEKMQTVFNRGRTAIVHDTQMNVLLASEENKELVDFFYKSEICFSKDKKGTMGIKLITEYSYSEVEERVYFKFTQNVDKLMDLMQSYIKIDTTVVIDEKFDFCFERVGIN